MQVSMDQQSTIMFTMPLHFQSKNTGKLPARKIKTTLNLYFHIVLKFEDEIFPEVQDEKLEKYIVGYARAKGADVEAVGIVGNRLHLVIALPQTFALADFVREIKLVSSIFAKRRLGFGNFLWRTDYDAFTVSLSQIERICRYVRRQVNFQKQESYASSWHPVSLRRLF